MTAKRFTTDNGSNEDVCLVDNLTKKEYESNFNDIVDLMNKIWEQTQRFEKHNKDLTKENNELKQELFETSKELLWATSDDVDRALYYEDEVEELRKEKFE